MANCAGNQRFVVLRGIEEGNVFYSIMHPSETEESVRYLNDGTLAYDVLLVTESEKKVKETLVEHCPWLAGLV